MKNRSLAVSSLLALVISSGNNRGQVQCFSPTHMMGRSRQQQQQQQQHQGVPLFSTSSHKDTDRELEELDRARAAFEEMYWKEQEKEVAASGNGGEQATIMPLTSAGRHRRNLELLLLASLRDCNDAVDELMHLWMYERDAASAKALTDMTQQCSTGLVEEERALREMVDRTEGRWAEPISRLAAILYYKGRLEESEAVAVRCLEVKPWHFEAIELLVMIALRNQDMGRALYWARRGLPRLREEEEGEGDGSNSSGSNSNRKNKRRKAWVDRALEQAMEQMAQAERAMEQLRQQQQQRGQQSSSSLGAEEVWQ